MSKDFRQGKKKASQKRKAVSHKRNCGITGKDHIITEKDDLYV